MCDPGTALLATSAGIDAFGQVQAGRAASAFGQFQNQIAQENARLERQAALADESRLRDQTRQAIGQQTARFAAANVDTGFGSPLIALAKSAVNAELDALRVRTGGQIRARDERLRGQLARAQGRSARGQAFLGAGATLLSGAQEAFF